MKTIQIVIGMMFFAMMPAMAQLGKSEQECVKLYGSIETSIGESGLTIDKFKAKDSDNSIVVGEFLDGKAVSFTFKSTDGKPFEKSAAQYLVIFVYVQSGYGMAAWNDPVATNGGNLIWTTPDNPNFMGALTQQGLLVVYNSKEAQRFETLKAKSSAFPANN